MNIVAIEAGGTKFILGSCDEHGTITDRQRIDTLDPNVTLKAVQEYIVKHRPDAVGIACFGPLDLDPTSSKFGSITSTPKPGWTNTPVVSRLRDVFDGPIAIDTDVNGAALAETLWGAAKGADIAVYITIGTGIGAGITINGQPVHGLLHPEFGHILLRSHPDDQFKGVCPYHDYCFEGLASGPSMEKRWGVKASSLDPKHSAWAIEAFYIAQACANLILTVSPQKIVLGGGVMHQTQLFPLIKENLRTILNGYIQKDEILKDSDLIVAPVLGDDAGLKGALALALKQLNY